MNTSMIWSYLTSLFLTSVAFAAGEGESKGTTITIPNLLSCNAVPGQSPIQCVLENFLSNLLILAIPICTLMVLIGAFQILTAGGDSEKFKKGRQTILYAAIGFALVLIASELPALIRSLVTPAAGTGPVRGFIDRLYVLMDWGFTFLIALSVIFVLYAAFMYVTANGDAEKVSKANRTILYAAIGVAVGVMAKVVPALVQALLS